MIDLLTLLPIISILIAGGSFYFARKKDSTDDAAKQSEVVTEIRAIRSDMSDLKLDVRELKNEWKSDHDDIVAMKRDFKTMWSRIDELKTLIQNK